MRKFYQNYIENNLFFWIFSVASLVLIIAGFIVPPLGTIDNSVLIAAGEINGTIALGCVLRAIDKGTDVSVQHNNTSVTITNKDEDGGEDDK